MADISAAAGSVDLSTRAVGVGERAVPEEVTALLREAQDVTASAGVAGHGHGVTVVRRNHDQRVPLVQHVHCHLEWSTE